MTDFVVQGHILEWFLKDHVTLKTWSNGCFAIIEIHYNSQMSYYLFICLSVCLFMFLFIYCNTINAALVSIRYNTNMQKVSIPNVWPVFTLHKSEHCATMSVNKYEDDSYDGDDTLVSSSSSFLQLIMFFSSTCHAEQVWSHGPVSYHREGHIASTSRPNPHHQHQRPQTTHCGALTAQPTPHLCLCVHVPECAWK